MIKNRQRKTKDPCLTCYLHKDRCICAQIPKLTLKTRVTLVVHAKELKRTTNSGRLAITALSNSEMKIRGRMDGALDLNSILDPNYQTYILFPCEGAVELQELKPTLPVHLIVPDGNWRQAAKMNSRHPELAHLPRVKISAQNMARYHLRKEHFAEGLSTLEAIALALEALEGKEVGQQMMKLYQTKLMATLAGRGKFKPQPCTTSSQCPPLPQTKL